MSSFTVLLLCIQACLIQNAFSTCLGGFGAGVAGPYGFGAEIAPFGACGAYGAYGYGAGTPFGAYADAPFGAYGYGAEFGYGAGFGGYGCGAAYGGAGVGNVAVAGELPVAGTTAIAGQVPIIGAVGYGGVVPAAGAVAIRGDCACGCGGCGGAYLY